MVKLDDERAEPIMRRIEQLELKELEAFARQLMEEEQQRHLEQTGRARANQD